VGTLDLYIYDSANDTADINTAISTSTFIVQTAPAAGDGFAIHIVEGSITRISTGFYEYVWDAATAPALWPRATGTWYDVWVAQVSGAQVAQTFTVTVIDAGTVALQEIDNNSLIVVLLDSTIAGVSGDTLGEEIQLSYSTTYAPYYASVDLLRLETGGWIDGIPDDTLALMIHWSSIEADLITGRRSAGRDYNTARTKFVIFDAALRTLMLPADLGGKTKRLGDLMIQNNTDFAYTMNELKRKREEWFRVVNAGGSIVPGQSFAPAVAAKGSKDPDRRRVGRLWWSTADFPYVQPTANTKLRRVSPDGTRKFRFGFQDKGE
jgi:hypothetical protein